MDKDYEVWAFMDDECTVVSEDFETPEQAVHDFLGGYSTTDEMLAAADDMIADGFVLCRLLIERGTGCWLECLEVIEDYRYLIEN